MDSVQSTLGSEFPASDQDRGANVGGDQIIVGNLQGTVAAVGRGAAVTYHQALTAADQARASENFEHEKLAGAVARLADAYYRQMQQPPALSGSPYKYLYPFEFHDAWRFFGREAVSKQVVGAVTGGDGRSRLAVLHGDTGIGKTSLVLAAVAPALVAGGHLPLLVRVGDEPLAQAVKGALIRDLERLPLLRDTPLREFLYQAGALLPAGKHVYVIVDQFEQFFDRAPDERREFVRQLSECLYAELDGSRWLLCVRSNKVGYLSTFAPVVEQPLANSLVVSPLGEEEARQAILGPAWQAGLAYEDGLVERVLEDLGRDAIDPSRLQLVCHTLVQSLPAGERRARFGDYEKIGGAERILQEHLGMAMGRLEPAEIRTAAWHVLVCLSTHPEGVTPEETNHYLDDYEIRPEQCLPALEALESNRLVRSQGGSYRLASASLEAPIREWASRQAALKQAQVEARRQLKRIRDSALRGLIGGGAGFALAYLVAFLDQTVDWFVLPFMLLFEGLLGGIAGMVYIFALDMARASFRGRLRGLRLVWGGVAGGIAFGAAILVHALLQFPPSQIELLLAGVQGVLWGLVAGVSIEALTLSRRPRWQTVPPLVIVSAAALWAGEQIGHAYHRPRLTIVGEFQGLRVLLAGALLFAALAAAALWRNPTEED